MMCPSLPGGPSRPTGGGAAGRAAGEGVASPSWRVTPGDIFKPFPHLLNEAFAQAPFAAAAPGGGVGQCLTDA